MCTRLLVRKKLLALCFSSYDDYYYHFHFLNFTLLSYLLIGPTYNFSLPSSMIVLGALKSIIVVVLHLSFLFVAFLLMLLLGLTCCGGSQWLCVMYVSTLCRYLWWVCLNKYQSCNTSQVPSLLFLKR